MSKKRDKRENRQKRGSGGSNVKRAATERRAFEPSSLSLPANTMLWYLKDAEPKRVDILNYCVGKGNPKADEGSYYYERRYWIHKGFGADGKQSFVCTSRTFGKKCAGCDYTAKLGRDPDADADFIKKLLPKERQIMNIIDRKDVKAGVQIWEVSWYNFGKLLELKIQNEDEEDNYHDFADWEGGLSLKCDIEDDKTYGRSVAGIEFKTRKDYDPDEIEKKVHCLDDLIKEPTYTEQKKIVMGMEEDEESKTKTFKESDVKKLNKMSEKELRKFVVINDLENEIDLDEIEDEDDLRVAVLAVVKEALEDKEEKPAKKAAKKKAAKKATKKKDEDEDEDEDDDDDSEDDDEDDSEDDDEDDEDDSEDDDEDDEDDDDDSEDDDEDDDDDSEDDDEEDEEEEKPAPKKRGRPAGKKKK